MRDITERRRIEAEVLEATEREQRRIAQTCTTGWGGNWPASPG